MTACAIENRTGSASDESPEEAEAPLVPESPRAAAEPAAAERPAAGRLTISADGAYGARLTPVVDGGEGEEDGGGAADGGSAESGWIPERWTLDGPEPYAVPLPGAEPEPRGSEVLPLGDGQVLILRPADGRHTLSLLYPAGTGTGERPLGAVECEALRLLPPAPDGRSACALGVGERSTALWMVDAGGFGPELITEIPGRCTGGAWLDRAGQLLALDRELDGTTKTVAVDLGRGGETSPLLQITEDSDDRLLLADPDSGLLLVTSDAPGDERLGWGVLGSRLPVRFPECLRPSDGAEVLPFAIQPGQVLMPESCAVALHVRVAGEEPWVGMWRPFERRLRRIAAPRGWLAGAGLWTADGELRLPYVSEQVPCGLLRVRPAQLPEDTGTAGGTHAAEPEPGGGLRPVPLQQAPLQQTATHRTPPRHIPLPEESPQPQRSQEPQEARWLRDRQLG